jgi:hypothetical protein
MCLKRVLLLQQEENLETIPKNRGDILREIQMMEETNTLQKRELKDHTLFLCL